MKATELLFTAPNNHIKNEIYLSDAETSIWAQLSLVDPVQVESFQKDTGRRGIPAKNFLQPINGLTNRG